MPLTAKEVENAQAKKKSYRLFDQKGLYLDVSPAGGKSWRMKYRYNNKEKCLTIGKYPKITLADARMRAAVARDKLDDGVDPSAEKQAEKRKRKMETERTFKAVALEWLENESRVWTELHRAQIEGRLENYAFYYLGDMDITEVATRDVSNMLRDAQYSAPTVAKRVSQMTIAIFDFAIMEGYCMHNVAAPLKRKVKTPPTTHYSAPTDPKKVGAILRMLDMIEGVKEIRCACRMLPLVFCRPGELVAARWEQVDLQAATWSYRVPKTSQDHIVPLATQVVEMLRELHEINQGHERPSEWVFRAVANRSDHIKVGSIGAAFKRIGIGSEELMPHGCRAMARTLLDEQLGYPPHIIEHQLAHKVKDPLGRAYNRTKHLPQRVEMMQAWADYLDGLKG